MSNARRLTGVSGRWSAVHPWLAISVWLGCVLVLQATGLVTHIQSPLDPRFANQISASRQAALLQFQSTGTIADSATSVAPVLDRVLARPALTAGIAAGLLILLAVPVLRLHTATPGASDLPQNTTALRSYNRVRGAGHRPDVPPISVIPNPSRTAAIIEVPLAGTGENAASAHALAVLRDKVIPATLGKVPGVQVAVTGQTAGTDVGIRFF